MGEIKAAFFYDLDFNLLNNYKYLIVGNKVKDEISKGEISIASFIKPLVIAGVILIILVIFILFISLPQTTDDFGVVIEVDSYNETKPHELSKQPEEKPVVLDAQLQAETPSEIVENYVILSEKDIFNLKSSINYQYENHISGTKKLSTRQMSELVDMCDTLLLNIESSHFKKVKMNVLSEIATMASDEFEKITYYDLAIDVAYELIQSKTEDIDIRDIQYTFAQLTYEQACLQKSKDNLFVSKEYFNSLKEYQPYWARHYLISINRRLFDMTDDENHLKESKKIIEDEMLTDRNYIISKQQALNLYISLIDIEYLSAKPWLYIDDKKVKAHYQTAKLLVEQSAEFGDSPYLESLVNKMEDYLNEN